MTGQQGASAAAAWLLAGVAILAVLALALVVTVAATR